MTRQELISLYNDFHAGKVTRNDVFGQLWPVLKPQIKSLLVRSSRLLNASYEDLMQEAVIPVLEHIPDYDPNRSVPGTFFLTYVQEKLRDLCRKDKSIYYMTKIRSLTKVALENGFDGIDDPRLSDVVLASLSGDSVQVVRKARYMGYIYAPADFDAAEAVADTYNSSPEEMYLKQEREDCALAAFHTLSELEQKVFTLHVAESLSFKEISRRLKANNRYLNLGFTKAPTSADLQRIYAVARRKLYSCPYIAGDTKEDDTLIEQASYEELSDFLRIEDI